MNSANPTAAVKVYALAFGLFLGLCIWKFGDPVILDRVIATPVSAQDFLMDAWPTHWANWFLLPLAAWGAVLVVRGPRGPSRLPSKWLAVLPVVWLAWQFVSASQTVATNLTAASLWQFSGCLAAYFLGLFLFSRGQLVRLLLIGALAAFAFCLVRAVDQHVFEYPQSYQMLIEGERTGWTNFPPATVAEMKGEGLIVNTNGLDVANPLVLTKFQKGRACGTLVYPNALAQIILLLWPVSLALAFGATRQLRPLVRLAVIALTIFLGAAAFFWSGSKLGWLLGIGLAGMVLLRLPWSKKLKVGAVATVVILGLGVFAIRFHHYFAAGATSAGARFDYWRAALQITAMHPALGTGPGTFQQPYAHLKLPGAEMARLTHNDYLEQFCDSGVVGGLAYGAWIVLAMVSLAKATGTDSLGHSTLKGHGKKAGGGQDPQKLAPLAKNLRAGSPKDRAPLSREPGGGARLDDSLRFALVLGLAGWFAQGLGEFGLYVPALAWTAFTLLGSLIGQKKPLIPQSN